MSKKRTFPFAKIKNEIKAEKSIFDFATCKFESLDNYIAVDKSADHAEKNVLDAHILVDLTEDSPTKSDFSKCTASSSSNSTRPISSCKSYRLTSFNPITDNVNAWLVSFENHANNSGSSRLSLIHAYLDVYGIEFFYQVTSENPSIEWNDFKMKFKKYFTNFKFEKTNEALMFSYTVGDVEEFVDKKIELLSYVFPESAKDVLERMAISTIKNDELIRQLNIRRTNKSGKARVNILNEFDETEMNFANKFEETIASNEPLTSASTSNLKNDLIDSVSIYSDSSDECTGIANNTNSDLESDVEFIESTSVSKRESFLEVYKRIVSKWLTKNYERTKNKEDLISKCDLLVELNLYLTSRGKEAIAKTSFGVIINSTFGRLRDVRRVKDDTILNYYGFLRKKTDSNQNDATDEHTNHYGGYNIVGKFLKDNFVLSANREDKIKCSDLYLEVNNYLKSLGKETLCNHKIGIILKSVHGEILTSRKYFGDTLVLYYVHFRKVTDQDDLGTVSNNNDGELHREYVHQK